MKMTERLERRKISEMIPYANNARTHSPAQIELLRRSLREFGFVSPVLIDAAGNVIAGHGRIEAARLEGIEEVPCVQDRLLKQCMSAGAEFGLTPSSRRTRGLISPR